MVSRLAAAQLGVQMSDGPCGFDEGACIHVLTCSPRAALSTTAVGNYSGTIPLVSTAVTLPLEGCLFRIEWVVTGEGRETA